MKREDILIRNILDNIIDYYEEALASEWDDRISLIMDGIQNVIETLED